MFKRIFDITCSLTGFIISLPLLIVLSILVKLSSPGSIIYKQERVGKNGKRFTFYKFRTMYINSVNDHLITIGDDDTRITPIGRFLRKYKLDELLQFVNVLSGDMSIVGPRPEVPKYVSLYTEEQREVLSVRPGITDVASIKFANENDLLANTEDPDKFYIEEIMPQKIELCRKYIKEQSFFLDLKIIFKTFFVIIRKKSSGTKNN